MNISRSDNDKFEKLIIQKEILRNLTHRRIPPSGPPYYPHMVICIAGKLPYGVKKKICSESTGGESSSARTRWWLHILQRKEKKGRKGERERSHRKINIFFFFFFASKTLFPLIDLRKIDVFIQDSNNLFIFRLKACNIIRAAESGDWGRLGEAEGGGD